MSTYGDVAGLNAYGVKPAAYPADITDPVKLDHLTKASSIADSYIRKRYGLPLSSYGADLSAAVYAIATFTLLRRRGFDPTNPADQLVVKGNDDAIAWLRDVAKGLAELADVVDATPGEPEAAPLFECDEQVDWDFSRETSAHWCGRRSRCL